ncbi:MAG: CDP-diacylglycerol--glycerol-3-phosphate 3-phosphatidyltransferase [Clostridia bacterium]|nr:CDP-diacylglycerol--glycerol-3-phosphate 3-phosphatidyltransferase [Clostridia bacterium]
MNTPNKITVFRMFIAPVFLVIFFLNIEHKMLISALIFALGAITDAIDGHLARKNNIVTNFGKFLDPIADKMLVTAAFLAFMQVGICNIWIVMLMITREFAITSVRLIAAAQGVVIPANIGGKIKTVFQMVSLISIMVIGEINEVFSLGLPLSVISNVMLGITAVISVVSGIVYLWDSRKVIDFKS